MDSESDDIVRTLYVSNLDRNVSEEILYELFLQAGPIDKVSIPKSRDKSFGFVTYKHICTVNYAIDLFKGTTLYNREIIVQKRKENRYDNYENRRIERHNDVPRHNDVTRYNDHMKNRDEASRWNRRRDSDYDSYTHKPERHNRDRRNFKRNFRDREHHQNRY